MYDSYCLQTLTLRFPGILTTWMSVTYLDAGMDRMGDSDLRLSSHYTVTTIIFFLHMLPSLRNAIKKWLHDKRARKCFIRHSESKRQQRKYYTPTLLHYQAAVENY
jgi:hypothetical protein